MSKKVFLCLLALVALMVPLAVSARSTPITDWYIKDFRSSIVVNQDSSLTVTETIVADCDGLPGKHGIFRTLPTGIDTPQGRIETPVRLLTITDQAGQKLKYATIDGDGTVTWKIGDADRTVNGENTYKISYVVKNAVRPQKDFDELYWNLNGNFWQIETDAFVADIKFPPGVERGNVDVEYFSGALGEKDGGLSKGEWLDESTLRVSSLRTLGVGEGVTISATIPKGKLTPYRPTLWDSLPTGWQWVFLPLLTFMVCFSFWRRYGDDPNLRRTVIAEYEVPDSLGPIEMGILKNHGYMNNDFITAAVVKMACDGVLTIEEKESKVLVFNNKDYELAKTGNAEAVAKLSAAEKAVYDGIFSESDSVPLSKMKKTFYKSMPAIEKAAKDLLVERGYMEKSGFKVQATMFVIGVGVLVAVFFIFGERLSWQMMVASGLSAAIAIFFAVIMSKKTVKGAEAEWKIKGFRLFIDKAEKYRAQFYEKENMFERILPYAIAFGLTKKWIGKMREIYGEQKFAAVAPVWFHSASASGFDADSFVSSLNSVSSAISSSASSSSGRGGGGFSGGGGGGGGGGGW